VADLQGAEPALDLWRREDRYVELGLGGSFTVLVFFGRILSWVLRNKIGLKMKVFRKGQAVYIHTTKDCGNRRWASARGIHWKACRVTRLGEFSPNPCLFAVSSYMKIAEVAHIFGLLYSSVELMN
jgi:hypothetical protein